LKPRAGKLDAKGLVKIVSSPLTWAEAVLIDPNTGVLFRANYAERIILSSKHRFNAIRVHRRAGKCIAASERLPLADGSWVEARELVGKVAPLWTLDEHGSIVRTWGFASWDASRDIYEVVTASGRRIRRTDNHPLYAYPGVWLETQNLRVGDKILAAAHLPFPYEPQSDGFCLDIRSICEDAVSGRITRFPKECFAFAPSFLSSLLRGLWDAARSSSEPPCFAFPAVEDSALAEELQVLLLRFGVLARVEGSRLYVDSRSAGRFWALMDPKADLEKLSLPDGECCFWDEVASVRRTGNERAVALTVPGRETFLTTLFEHNTTSLSVVALWRALTREHSEILIITPAASQSDNIFYVLREFLRVNPALQAEVVKDVQKPQTLIFSNGSKILGMTAGSQGSKKAVGIRGQGADLVLLDETDYLNDDDFEVINPIILGDPYRKEKGSDTVVFAASTPSENRGRFYRWCTSDPLWHKIHIPVTENPDYDETEIELRRAMATEAEWEKEWLATWSEAEGGLFKAQDIEAAAAGPKYVAELGQRSHGAPRVLGVDWDQVSSGPNLVVLEIELSTKKVNLVFREELPRSQYTMVRAVEHIISLDSQLDFDWIYVDEGFGAVQIELLKKYGEHSGAMGAVTGKRFVDKIVGINFGSSIDVPDPISGGFSKKPVKPFMVNNLVKLFEDRQIQFWVGDEALKKELMQYRIVSTSGKQVQYTRTKDHIVSALLLAYHAIFMNYTNPFEVRKPTRVYVMQVPKYTPSAAGAARPLVSVVRDPEEEFGRSFADLSRTHLGQLKRTGF